MTIRAISIDDDFASHSVLAKLILAHRDIVLVEQFTDPALALTYMSKEPPDLLFLDVTMPTMSGLELLKQAQHPPLTVLVTADPAHAFEAFELGVREYLLKPVSPDRLAICLDRMRPILAALNPSSRSRPPGRLAFKQGHQHVLIDPQSVAFIEADGNFAKLSQASAQIFVSESIRSLEERLSPFGFARVHKSFLVNPRQIRQVQSHCLTLTSGAQVPVGRAYRSALRQLTDG